MSQRVNIQYSVPLEDLESEVERLIKRSFARLSGACDAAHESARSTLELSTYETIDTLRQELGAIDISLAEINHLISSYLSYKAQGTTTPETHESAMPTELEMQEALAGSEELSQLHDKLARFKRAMGTDVTGEQHDNSDQG
tara:strand:+ start:7 stop:432 length:426 start_codon:yes stop_codon:yes gene_type:complete